MSTPTDTQLNRLFDFWDLFVKSNVDKSLSPLNADLIFIPLHLENHFFCVCINFISQTIEILDNKLYKDLKCDHVRLASYVVCYSFYLFSLCKIIIIIAVLYCIIFVCALLNVSLCQLCL